jgi:hypothetical protein
MFNDNIEYNSSCFYASKDLIHIFGVTGKKHITFLLPALSPVLLPALDPVPDPALRPTLHPAQKWWANWRLWYWRPVVGESGTWVFLMLIPSSY